MANDNRHDGNSQNIIGMKP